MAQCATPRLRCQFHRLQTQPPAQPGLGLEAVLPAATIAQVLRDEGGIWRSIVYTPWLTFWAFFWQVLSPDRSCRSALKRLAAWMGLRGQELDDDDTGPYCKARARLPESALGRLMRLVGWDAHRQAPEEWLWCGRRVKVADGSTAIMADTPANQRAYPQLASQQPGLGFPILRFVAIFCLATGSALELAMGKYQGKQTGENALFRSLWDDAFEPDDVALGDRYYCSYFDIAMLKRRGVDSVFRLHQRRPCDFRRGRRLGKEDQVVEWLRPKRPDWMSEEIYHSIPRRWRSVRCGSTWGSRGSAPACWIWPRPSWILICTRNRILVCYTGNDGMPSWICGRSRSCWGWICCGARRRRWCARRSG